MPTILGYGPSAITVSGGTVVLDPEWDASTDAFTFAITDGDSQFQGDSDVNESGDDTSQDAVVTDGGGSPTASGRVYLEDRTTFTDPDGNTINLYRVEIAGTHVGWVADGFIQPGVTYTVSSTSNVTNNDAPDYSSLENATYDPDPDNTITGGANNDELHGDSGSDLLYGGGGDDIALADDFAPATDTGDDTVYGGGGNDLIGGSAGDDTLYGGTGNDKAEGRDGADTLYGGSGGDTLVGFDANNLNGGDLSALSDDGSADLLDGGAGNDLLSGGAGEDIVFGGGGKDLVYGGTGDDFVQGNAGDDTVYGGAGNDTVFVDSGSDTGFGGAGNDVVAGNFGQNLLYGGDGDDHLQAGTDADTLYGGDGEDTVVLGDGFGADTLYGGTTAFETDRLDVSALSTGVTVDFTFDDTGTVTDGTDTANFQEFEDFVLTDQADSVDATNLSMDLTIDAGGGGDVILTHGVDGVGNTNVDTIYAGAGADTVYSGGADDIVYGGDGADSISSGFAISGAGDTVYGGAGDDIIDTVDHSTGTTSGVGDLVYGGTGNDSITGAGGAGFQGDTLFGGAGNDTIDALGGNDTVFGGDDQDTFVVNNGFGSDTIYGGEGGTDLDTLDLSALGPGVTVTYTGNEQGTFTDGIDTGTFFGIENVILTDQDDVFSANIDDVGISVDGAGGEDTLIGGTDRDVLTGGLGNDSISGGADFDTLYGGTGDDTLDGGTQDDVIYGGDGDDSINAGMGSDTVYGGDGDDFVEATTTQSGDATIYGGAGNDTLQHDLETHAVYGGTGDDRIVNVDATGSGFATTIDGGTGIDTYVLDASEGAGFNPFQTVNLGAGQVQFNGSFRDSITGIENVEIVGASANAIGDGNANTITGVGIGDNSFFGGDGNDLISGGLGNDTLGGDEGDDTVIGGDGNDVIDGGEGADILYAGDGDDILDDTDIRATGNPGDTFYAGAGNDTLRANFDTDTFYGGDGTDTYDIDGSVVRNFAFEIDLSSNSDTFGNQYFNIENVIGGTQADSVVGDAGDNVLEGRDGDDTLSGGGGADDLDGGAGRDTLEGGAGDDTLTGGTGNDTFVISAGGGSDTITDFGTGADQLDSSALTDAGNLLTNQDGTVTADEVTVTGGGGSDQVLTFPNGETLTVPDGTVDQTSQQTQFASLVAMGVPPCFAPGTLIETPDGPCPVEDLRIGDLVRTADHGPQPLRWIGRREVAFGPDNPRGIKDKPIEFKRGALGGGLPRRDLVVSPQHRMVLSGPDVAERFGEGEVFAIAKALTTLCGVRVMNGKRRVTYHALLFDRHEVIFAEGAATESFRPGPTALAAFAPEHRAEIFAIYPGLSDDPEKAIGPPARPIASRREIQALIARRPALLEASSL